ncbi:DUF4357 domain-containing protein [Capnocytophaga genosp. AHN8471]|uniref:DUF4357 domain-containing protein n=1 Tax=Capnocytophaga TaxID=1016 RepID=UPI0002A23ABC|nr:MULTISPECIES: DUF4357 domain-containing protein [Capnocytophaga]EKY13752.1 putative ATP synthase F1, delta subunit [Capnocytophaga sp. oral taxon 326 str. F0382]MBM0656050.1 DUF4357 domain-containing protein [Capnocytophaga genosp. AHN8471]
MRIKEIKIANKAFKNLDVSLENNTSGVMAFIGNNGSGKSNLLEAISAIFKHLYDKKEKDIPFNFSLTYIIGSSKDIVKITKKGSSVTTEINSQSKSDPYNYLPKQIVAIYSGEEDRLWKKYYLPTYQEYIAKIGVETYNNMPKMLYINKFYWHISLLCLLLNQFNNLEDTFCSEILGIENTNSIKFSFNKANYKSYKDSIVKQFISKIDKKQEYTLEELRMIIEQEGYTLIDVYKFFYIAFTPADQKMLQDIVIKYNNENLEIEDFSEGEKKMILIKAALEFAAQEDSLFILDEPDAHIHLSNKMQIKKVLEEYEQNRQVIITTHSPTLTDCLDNESIYMLDRGKLISAEKQKVLESISGEFWNRFQQNTFISSKSPIILLVEGKLDKIHINNAYRALKEEYPNLNFDIFCLNSETKIQPFLSGLYESDFETDKLYIGVYDNDEAGHKSYKSFDEISQKSYKKLKENNKAHNTYFSVELPKPEGITCDCTIETMYDYTKWEEAYQQAVQHTSGKTKDKSIDKYCKDVLQEAKNILAENSNSFVKEDFKNFRKLFDLIKEIAQYAKTLKDNTITNEKPKNTESNTPKSVLQANVLPQNTIEVVLKTQSVDALAWYNTQSGEITLKKGSKLALEVVDSYKKQEKQRLKELKKIAEQTENNYILKEDKKCKSVSGAACFVLGRTANGWVEWRIKENNNILDSIRINKNS